jgi:hypothetical protein
MCDDPEQDGLVRYWKTVKSWQELKKERLQKERKYLSSINPYKMEMILRRGTVLLNKHPTGSITHISYEHKLLSSSMRVAANEISLVSIKKRPIPAVQPSHWFLIVY